MSPAARARRELRTALGTHEDRELARAFATYRTAFADLLAQPGAGALSQPGQDALEDVRRRAGRLLATVAGIDPRVDEADRAIAALDLFDDAVHDLRLALRARMTVGSAARARRAAARMRRGGARLQRVYEELHG